MCRKNETLVSSLDRMCTRLTKFRLGIRRSGLQLRLEDFANSDEVDWDLEGDVEVEIVPGGLFSNTEPRWVTVLHLFCFCVNSFVCTW